MHYYFGIDFGTTTTAISKINGVNSDPELLELIGDATTVDTIVQFNDIDDLKINCIGTEAWEKNLNVPDLTAFEFKLNIGNGQKFRNFSVTADTISRSFLTVLREKLEQLLNRSLANLENSYQVTTVIGYPAGWQDSQKAAIVDIAKNSGFPNVIGCEEPLGAVYFHHHRGELAIEKDQYVLVYDFGGGTTDVAIVKTTIGVVPMVISVAGKTLGGKHFDVRISKLLQKEILEEISKDNLPAEDRLKIRCAAKKLKEKLSREIKDGRKVAEINIPFLRCKSDEHTFKLTKDTFEKHHSDYLIEAVTPIHEALNKAKLNTHDISVVVATGGSARFYFVQDKLEACFPSATVLQSTNPQETISKGLALYCKPVAKQGYRQTANNSKSQTAHVKQDQKTASEAKTKSFLFGKTISCVVLIFVVLIFGKLFSAELNVTAVLNDGWLSDSVTLQNNENTDLTHVNVSFRTIKDGIAQTKSFQIEQVKVGETKKIGDIDPDTGSIINVIVQSDQGKRSLNLKKKG